jgi:hypothetical protein
MSGMLNPGTVADVRSSRWRASGDPTQSLNGSEPHNQAFPLTEEGSP